jgi:hypothetical protein
MGKGKELMEILIVILTSFGGGLVGGLIATLIIEIYKKIKEKN